MPAFPYLPRNNPMASLTLYAKNPRVPNRYAIFPDDFSVVGHSTLDDSIASHPSIASRRWFKFSPQSTKTCYGRASERIDGKYVIYLLHRVVWECANGPIPYGLQIDHVNRNGLDNRLENLRLVNHSQQVWNRSKLKNKKYTYKGVDPKQGRWRAYMSSPKVKKLHLGVFDTMEEAAFAYDVIASRSYGEFAELNNIPDELVSPSRKQEIERKVLKKVGGNLYAQHPIGNCNSPPQPHPLPQTSPPQPPPTSR